MASHYHPLQEHSGSVPAQCLGSTEHTHTNPCSGVSLGWPLFDNSMPCYHCCIQQERIKLQILFTEQLEREKKAEKELRRVGGGHGGYNPFTCLKDLTAQANSPLSLTLQRLWQCLQHLCLCVIKCIQRKKERRAQVATADLWNPDPINVLTGESVRIYVDVCESEARKTHREELLFMKDSADRLR